MDEGNEAQSTIANGALATIIGTLIIDQSEIISGVHSLHYLHREQGWQPGTRCPRSCCQREPLELNASLL